MDTVAHLVSFRRPQSSRDSHLCRAYTAAISLTRNAP